ncbi:adhesion G protein-coupled receptor E3-like [Astyanax mexicanus]|uniref:Adhesion G protein-coupled receptor E3-like n=1 Tax=Astyanax mexicanus TaxID=7994 RepID=A0A8T2KY21_ASTMX|nr:adhesion G protein-coupled receptor E3-like [Astyanax mexicanus]
MQSELCQVVTDLLDKLLNSTKILEEASSSSDQRLVSYGNSVLNATETLVSLLVHKTDTYYYKNISLPSTVEPEGTVVCVNWRETEWVEGSCELRRINSSFTSCFCVHPGTFALIMQTGGSSRTTLFVFLLNTVAVPVGLVFLTLSLLTFIFCQKHSLMINTALINLCISLFLAHLIFLLTQTFLLHIYSIPMLCAVLAGVLHFLFLSAFVWMLIEAVLLFISVKNLTKIRSKQKEVLGCKHLTVIGYLIPLFIVGVSAGGIPDGYGSNQCWLKLDKGFRWSFLAPVCLILALNLILFIIIGIIMISTLRKMKRQAVQMKVMRSDKRLIESVMVKTLLQFVIIGCFWTLGFFTESSDVLKILFLIINSQQGTFIFLVHCVLNSEVRQQYRKWIIACFSFFQQKEKTATEKQKKQEKISRPPSE